MADAGGEDRVCVAAIAGAFGVRGEVRLKCFTAEPDAIGRYGPVETEDGSRRFDVGATRPIKGGLAARLSGIGDRDTAEGLKGTRLYVARAALPEPDEDEFYHADLIGLEAVTPDGERLGVVRAVQDFGAGDLLEIGQGKHARYVPFTKVAVPEIDLAAKRLTVVLPPEDEAKDEERTER